ncbi:recombinase family protein, partial [Patescibacteria group bacterium]|nr:recombinase family protein [Patescibacteria group bacterium]
MGRFKRPPKRQRGGRRVITEVKEKVSTKALIYCRVSSVLQATDGHGLDSQEHRCRIFAEQKGLQIIKVFHDSVTGGGDFWQRPAMRELLEYVDACPTESFTVIFDDLKRFARDTQFHWKLRTEFSARGITPACLNFNFEDTPEGGFIETIMAAQGELERKQNRRQVIQKQKARMEAGYWPFGGKKGYTIVKDPAHGKICRPNAEGKILAEALGAF